ncbi:hypothetical protein [Sphingomonas arenae]|nr:hypothetical protein [Sphingomonas arenae]
MRELQVDFASAWIGRGVGTAHLLVGTSLQVITVVAVHRLSPKVQSSRYG